MNRCKGFTLPELAIAFVIIALLLAGALVPLSTQLEVRNVADTRRIMDQVRDAIIGFAQANGRLPCPARGQTASGSLDTVTWGLAIAAGAEQYDVMNKRCYTVLGVVPWSTLGVPETDAWGRRFTYRVSPAFADDPQSATLKTWSSTQSLAGPPALPPPQTVTNITSPQNQNPACDPSASPPTQSSFALCSLGDIAVFTRNESKSPLTPTAIGAGLPAVFISHGRNGYGAWQPSGTRVLGANDTDGDGVPDQNADEAANVTGTSTLTPTGGYLSYAFYSRNPTPFAGTCSDTTAAGPYCEFDDIIVMIPPSTLMARMISAGRLP